MKDKRYYRKIKAAYLIYKERLPLKDVSQILGISRPTLAKLIDEILQEGIVTIQITDPLKYEQNIEIGYEIKQRYGLKDAVIADVSSQSSEDIINSIGQAGAEYLQDFLHSDMAIGMTGGRSIDALVSNLERNSHIQNFQVISMTGGSLYANTRYHSNTVAQRLADLYKGTGHFIYAPTYADNLEQKNVLLQNSQIIHTLEYFKSIEIALTGIGSPSTALQYLPHPVEQWFQETPLENLAGAINTVLIDKNGDLLPSPVSQLSIGLSLEQLRDIKTVIALAGGEEKHTAIKAALRGGYIDVLVTDQYTAKYLLEDE